MDTTTGASAAHQFQLATDQLRCTGAAAGELTRSTTALTMIVQAGFANQIGRRPPAHTARLGHPIHNLAFGLIANGIAYGH